MARIYVLDSGPLGILSHPAPKSASKGEWRWVFDRLYEGSRVIVPEIADYEVRRELIRANKRKGLESLDRIVVELEYLPLTTQAMRLAAALWATARKLGKPTASETALDADVILAAQTRLLPGPNNEATVITTNSAHISRFVLAEGCDWLT